MNEETPAPGPVGAGPHGAAAPGPEAAADRAEAMGRRLDRTARRLGLDTADRHRLERAFRLAMEPRRAAIPDDHHPDYLHPARTTLILMDDVRETDPHVLLTALLTETRSPDLRVPLADVRRLDGRVADSVAEIPGPHSPEGRRLEDLLALPEPVARVAAAERLDHARHLHLRDRAEWVPYHALTCRAYAPVAGRLHPKLAHRLDWWCRTFHERFIEDGR